MIKTSPEEHAPVQLFLVDDHGLLRGALAVVMAHHDDLELTGQAATINDATVSIGRALPEVVLLKANLPDGSGLQLCRRLRDRFPGMRFIVFDAAGQTASSEAIAARADAFLEKSAPLEDLLDAIRKVALRSRPRK